MTLIEALTALDHNDDEHWTKDGAPRLETLEQLTGGNVTREMVRQAAPDFARGNPLPQPSEMPVLEELSDVQRAELEATDAEAGLNAAHSAYAEAKRALDEAGRRHNRAQEALVKARGPNSFAVENRRYLDTQQRLREERVRAPIDNVPTRPRPVQSPR